METLEVDIKHKGTNPQQISSVPVSSWMLYLNLLTFYHILEFIYHDLIWFIQISWYKQ